jgi:hypothetical protein
MEFYSFIKIRVLHQFKGGRTVASNVEQLSAEEKDSPQHVRASEARSGAASARR